MAAPVAASIFFPGLCLKTESAFPARTSVEGGELAAYTLALETFVQLPACRPRELRIFTDTMEDAEECRKRNSPSRKVRDINQVAAQQSTAATRTLIAWISAYMEIAAHQNLLCEQAAQATPHVMDHAYVAPSLGEDADGDWQA